MLVIRQNPFNGKVNTRDLDITDEQVAAYEAGALLQNAFPNLSADDREFYKTGIDNWEEMFGEEAQMATSRQRQDLRSYKATYNKEAVDRAIKKDPTIKGKEAKLIHRLLKGRS